MAKKSLLESALTAEARKAVLREAVVRYRNELLDDEERMLLLDRIRRLRRALGVLARWEGCSRRPGRGADIPPHYWERRKERMEDQRIQEGLLRLVRRLEPTLGRREPSIKEATEIIQRHGLEDKTLPELARMGFAARGGFWRGRSSK
jgi:hypothetical protein